MYVLETALPAKPAADAPVDEQNVWATKDDDHNLVQCLMLACMSPGLQKRFEFHKARDMIRELDALYKETAKSERYDIMKALMDCKMAEGSSVGEHVVKMIGYSERLKALEISTSTWPYDGHVAFFTPPVLRRFCHELQHDRDGEDAGRGARHAENYRRRTAEKSQASVACE